MLASKDYSQLKAKLTRIHQRRSWDRVGKLLALWQPEGHRAACSYGAAQA